MKLGELIPRFSLRTLLLATLLATSLVALWLHWQSRYRVRVPGVSEAHPEALPADVGPAATPDYDPAGYVWRQRRPEGVWGLLGMWEIWFSVGFAALLACSIHRDRTSFRSRETPSPETGPAGEADAQP